MTVGCYWDDGCCGLGNGEKSLGIAFIRCFGFFCYFYLKVYRSM